MTMTTILAVLIVGVAGVVVASVVEDDPAPVAGVDDLDDSSAFSSRSGASSASPIALLGQLTSADAPNIEFGLPPRKWVTISNSGDIDTGGLSCDDALRLVVESYVMHMDDDIREYHRGRR